MKVNKIVDFIKIGNINFPKFMLKEYRKIGINSDQFLFLVYLINKGEKVLFDIEIITAELGLNSSELLELIDQLKEKKLLEMTVEKKDQKVIGEYLVTDIFYNKMGMLAVNYINNDENKKEVDNVYEIFEKEFGRSLSPIEYEIIKAWIESNTKEDLILEALKEATYNGVSNLRYIDKILYEWNKKGLKDVQAVRNYKNKYRENKKEKVEVFNYNWLEDEE
jgi:DNA replication protein